MLDYTDRLVPRFNRDDKIPITDGHIDVYSKPGESNEHWDGKVDVQIKSSKYLAAFPAEATFRLTRIQLRNYQRNGGVLLFLVLVNTQTRTEQPYYLILDRFAIANWTAKIKPGKSSIDVRLTPFPAGHEDIERIVRLALQMQKHVASVPVTHDLLEQATSIRIFSLEDLNLSRPQRLSREHAAFSAELILGGDSSVPLSGDFELIPAAYTERELPFEVGVGDLTFAHATTRRIDSEADGEAEIAEIKLGAGLTLILTRLDGDLSMSVDLTLPDSLADRLRAVDFFLAMARGKVLEVDGKKLGSGIASTEPVERLDRLVQVRAELAAYSELCAHLGIDQSLVDVENATSDALSALKILRTSMVDGSEHEDSSGHTGLFNIPVGDRQILFLCLPGSSERYWRHLRPFSGDDLGQLRYSNIDDPDESYPITAYDMLTAEEVCKTLNLQLETVVDTYRALGTEESVPAQANDFSLKLLLAADLETDPDRRSELLDGARRLCEWLLENDENNDAYKVNLWQNLHRRGEIDDLTRSEIRSMRRRSARLDDEVLARRLELSCALLLGDAEEVEDLIADLPHEERTLFAEWPIWHLRPQTSP
ncbi:MULTISPECIES: hypothetical protein [Microbacterium]|nr:hypothetical protein [Microbacterium sp. p3-SID338]MCT1394398.1 hypothetical protein [Microbacterium sp. p3-SID338]